METIDIAALESVTGGRSKKVTAVKTAMKLGKKALEYGGRAMEVMETVGAIAEGAGYVKQGYDWLRGKKQPDDER